MEREPKLLIISQALAPSVGGSSILLNNLFSYYQGEVKAISGYHGIQVDHQFRTPFPTEYLNPPEIPFFGKYLKAYHDHYLKYLHLFLVKRIIKKIRCYKPDIIFSNCPDIDYFICAYKAAKKCKIPFYSHMHDLWEENHSPETYVGKMAIKWEKEILLNSKRVFCMTNVQQKHYEHKYGIHTDLLPHTIKDSDLDMPNLEYHPNYDNTLLFTGAVSRVMNLDALKVLSKASERFSEKINICLCTSTKHEDFKILGVDSHNWEIKWLSREKVQDLQRHSGVLFAPLSHKNGGMDEIKTVFSTKILEYLVSGRPIIIFAPHDSFHALSAKEKGWAFVIDEDNPEKLADGIIELLNNPEMQKGIVEKAIEEAKNRRASTQAAILYEWVKFDSSVNLQH